MREKVNVKVWGRTIRIFHWSLVLFFTIAYLSGDDADTLHEYSGYIIIVLLAFRMVWGFIGTPTARFRSFIYSPAETRRYARAFITRHPIHYKGHNPFGSLMIFALLIFIGLTCWTGLEVYALEGRGPLAQEGNFLIAKVYADSDGQGVAPGREGDHDFWEGLHEFFANFTVFLIILHIVGAVAASIVHGENLIKAMVTGKLERVDKQDE